MKKVAVFDIDGTIFRSSLLIELVNILIEKEIFPEQSRADFENEHKKWLERKGDYESYIGVVVEVFMKNIKGVRYDQFMLCSDILFSRQSNHLYRYTRDLVKKLKKQNYYLLAISQSPKAVLEKFCRKMGFDKVYGRVYEIGPTDRFTGAVTDVHLISNKAAILRRAIQKEGLTLKGSIAVGDTEDDIAMLEEVNRPICFNPNNILYRHAKRRNWTVVVERKDVIYTINK